MAGSEAAKEAEHLGRFLEELGFHDGSAIELAIDNTGARDLAYNPEHHSRVKHIERRHFFIRECVENAQISVPYVKSSDNLADFFTKPLVAKTFYRLRDEIMNVPRGSSLSGSAPPPAASAPPSAKNEVEASWAISRPNGVSPHS